ncbi:hypothetical protein WMY93_014835 [Mugilogobius chulae]|uniref:Immunoglobulin subtype domain-containing protein n=1 Tax=Mugilogobius chulae TaxID=88201 RepID=A0AAW0P5G3_9GOBI
MWRIVVMVSQNARLRKHTYRRKEKAEVMFGGKPGLSGGIVYTAGEGGDFRKRVTFFEPGEFFFCKNDCNSPENILVSTSGSSVSKGRYRIDTGYRDQGKIVVIENLMSSDSGVYRFEIRPQNEIVGFEEFAINIIKENKITTVASAHSSTSVTPLTGRYVSTTAHVTSQIDNLSREQSNLYAILAMVLAAALILLLVVVSIVCWRRRVKRQKASESKERTQIPETELYENVRAVNASADDTYQSLCVDTMDPNQIYSSI